MYTELVEIQNLRLKFIYLEIYLLWAIIIKLRKHKGQLKLSYCVKIWHFFDFFSLVDFKYLHAYISSTGVLPSFLKIIKIYGSLREFILPV